MNYDDYVALQDEINNSPLFEGDELDISNARRLMELVDTLPTLKRVIREESKNE